MEVLYIDDEDILLKVIDNYFEVLGCHTDCFDNIEDGTEHLNNKKYQLVMVDYNMPGLDLEHMIDYVHKEMEEPRILITSGENREFIDIDINQKSIFFIKKPFTINDLSDKMCQMFPDKDFSL